MTKEKVLYFKIPYAQLLQMTHIKKEVLPFEMSLLMQEVSDAEDEVVGVIDMNCITLSETGKVLHIEAHIKAFRHLLEKEVVDDGS